MKDAIPAEGADRQRLRIVFEGIRRRFGAVVAHLQRTPSGRLGRMALELIEGKCHVGSVLLNRAGLHETLDPKVS